MDIERLKELTQSEDSDLWDYKEELIALIDAEIARQSVATEEVAEAILLVEELAEIHVPEWRNEESSMKVGDDCSINECLMTLAITALKAYQLPSAIKWTGDNLREVINLIGWNESASSKWTWAEYEQVVEEKGLKIFTPSGSVMAGIGDWIIYDGKDCYVTTQKKKSATSEDVAEALYQMNEALGTEYLESDGEWTCYNEFSTNAIRTAITALQAYQPTTRKNRIVEEVAISKTETTKTETTSCEWCKGDVSQYFDVNWYDFIDGERGNVNHCPNCGRKLTCPE